MVSEGARAGERDRLSNLEGRGGLSGSVWSKRERFLGASSAMVVQMGNLWFVDS